MNSSILVLGVTTGMTYGLLAVGLVIVYRVSKVINFAHGSVGALGASMLGMLVVKYHMPYWIAFAIAIATSALAGALAEAAVVRRLRNAPRIMSLVATLGLAAFFEGVGPALYAGINQTISYPNPSGLFSFNVGNFTVTPAVTAMLLFSPLLVTAFALFLRYSRYGLALRAAAANAATARTIGIRASRMSMLAWMVASGFAGFTAILVQPTRGFAGGEPFGPALLLRALAAAVIARMTSLPIALLAGIGIGVAEQTIYQNVSTPGLPSVFIFAILFLGLVVQRRGESRTRDSDAWAVVAPNRELRVPPAVAKIVRRSSGAFIGLAFLLAVLIPLLGTNSTSIGMAAVLGLAVVSLSVGVISGLGGHLSLGQFAFAGVGAVVSLRVANATHNYILSFLCAGAAAAIAAVIVGLPALRIRGIMYAVATLGFGYVAESYLLSQSWLVGDNTVFDRPKIVGFTFSSGKSFYLFSLGILLVSLLVVQRIRSGGLSRSFIALRDNEDAARAFCVPAMLRTLQLFGLAGFLAGIGGATWAHATVYVNGGDFSDQISIDVVAAAVLGGLSFGLGPLLGALYIFAFPQFVHLDSASLAGTALGWLLVVLYLPSGLGSVVIAGRDVVVRWLVRRSGDDTAEPGQPAGSLSAHATTLTARAHNPEGSPPDRSAPRPVILTVTDLRKSFGGVQAVNGVSLEVTEGEILGLIGPNGAGKTTFFELLSGFTKADSGELMYLGNDITRWSPESRARAGLVRSFQDSKLFPTMTVVEALRLAQERSVPVRFANAIIAGGPDEKARDRRAQELVELMGLQTYAGKRINELSTGTRRITELACVVSMSPKLLLLDEPSTGIAQRESEALGSLLRQIRDYLDATLVVIEHDVPLIMGLADRIAAMEAGQLITVDRPQRVARDPRVIESYLGGDPTAINRSGLARPATKGRKPSQPPSRRPAVRKATTATASASKPPAAKAAAKTATSARASRPTAAATVAAKSAGSRSSRSRVKEGR